MATGRRSSDDQALLPTTDPAGAAQQPPPAPALVYACFFAIPLGYAGPWVMIGALISYIKAQHGSEAYRLMYLCYYAAGLPMSLLQQRYDATADAKYTSGDAYWVRGILMFVVTLGMVAAFPATLGSGSAPLLGALMFVLGCSTWALHGSAGQLAQLAGFRAILAQQLGFQAPAVISLAAVFFLGVDAQPTDAHLFGFYVLTNVLVAVGFLAWVVLFHTTTMRRLMLAKDGGSLGAVASAAARARGPQAWLARARPTRRRRLIGGVDDTSFLDAVGGDDGDDGDGGDAVVLHGDDSAGDTNGGGGDGGDGDGDDGEFAPRLSAASASLAAAASPLSAAARARVAATVRPAQQALFVTMFCSIFTASYFVAVPAFSEGSVISEQLYFVRLFADLAGRPLASVQRCIGNQRALRTFAAGRVGLMVAWFVAGFAGVWFGWSRSRALLLALQFAFSGGSGFVSILASNFAALELESKDEQAYSGAVLNTAYQAAMFSAIVASTLLEGVVQLAANGRLGGETILGG